MALCFASNRGAVSRSDGGEPRKGQSIEARSFTSKTPWRFATRLRPRFSTTRPAGREVRSEPVEAAVANAAVVQTRIRSRAPARGFVEGSAGSRVPRAGNRRGVRFDGPARTVEGRNVREDIAPQRPQRRCPARSGARCRKVPLAERKAGSGSRRGTRSPWKDEPDRRELATVSADRATSTPEKSLEVVVALADCTSRCGRMTHPENALTLDTRIAGAAPNRKRQVGNGPQ